MGDEPGEGGTDAVHVVPVGDQQEVAEVDAGPEHAGGRQLGPHQVHVGLGGHVQVQGNLMLSTVYFAMLVLDMSHVTLPLNCHEFGDQAS